MKLTNIFTNERAAIRKRVADVGEALRLALKKTNKFLAKHNITSEGEQKEASIESLTDTTWNVPSGWSATSTVVAEGIVRIPPRIRYLAFKHKKARVRKKNQKRIHKMMYGK